jgi:hypothetical protein
MGKCKENDMWRRFKYPFQLTGKTTYSCLAMSIFLNQFPTAARPPPSPLKIMINDKTLSWRKDIPQFGVKFV